MKELNFLLVWWLYLASKASRDSLSRFIDERRRRVRRLFRSRLLALMLQSSYRFLLDVFSRFLSTGRPRVVRSVWTKARSEIWWRILACRSWSERDWKVCRKPPSGDCVLTFVHILREETLDFVRLCLLTSKWRLWRLAGNSEYRTISHLFGLGKSTACTIVNKVCRAIVRHLLKDYVRLPSGRRLFAVIQKFQHQQGFPQVGGVIDGTHIPIKAPLDYPDEYYNRKAFHSVVLQAVVDPWMCFTNICVGWPGRVHDARVFSNSSLHQLARPAGTCFPGGPSLNIDDVEVPVLLLGDAAYPLLPWLMKPYPQTEDRHKQVFNKKLSSTRIVVERAFGSLKGRFRILLKQQDTSLKNVCHIITASCILHNYCLGDGVDDDWLVNGDDEDADVGMADAATARQANATREALMHCLLA